MKKLTLFIAALAIAGSSFADGKCCKGKKEACAKEKKEACAKGKGCCKKDAKAKETATTTTTKTTSATTK